MRQPAYWSAKIIIGNSESRNPADFFFSLRFFPNIFADLIYKLPSPFFDTVIVLVMTFSTQSRENRFFASFYATSNYTSKFFLIFNDE